jgi:tetratricopeptide (TPR) repeat protein
MIILFVVAAVAIWNSPEVLDGRAESLREQGRYAEAEAIMRDAAQKAPNNPLILNNLAWVYYLDGQYAMGEPYARRAVALSPNPSYIDTLAHIDLGLQHLDAAEQEFKSVLRVSPKLAESLDGLGQVYERRKKYEQALLQYRKALDANPNIKGTKSRITRIETLKGRDNP